ncbi:nuclear transport factor 2 family protein [Micromonospora sp. KC606]|uniref:nuclear transport factor 2 family protein n=1 Tax=Micromonospora sp. KC606 TaxID=2530379 RepID=UPI0010511162|nr:nuclear transport factor 2 family protein [Micromonospora sp. KC606]TDC83805.1 nuclear transport factor 2 family protein [Micromonospora sp. KC606]
MATNHEIITEHYAASDAGDLAGMLAPLTQETRWTEAAGFPCAGTYVGPDAVAENVFDALQKMFDGFTLRVDEVVDAGEVQIGIGTYTGTYRATGKAFRARVAHIWRLADGKVISFEQITDTLMVDRCMH